MRCFSMTMTTAMNFKTGSIYNVPNALTTVRFGLAIAVIALLPMNYLVSALIIFIIAVSTDWMDGYWARKYGQVTRVGRIFDPFVDKIIICGTFIALVEVAGSGVASWMATIMVARELLVTSLRAIIEGGGGDFSANQLGKWKMVLQCAAVIAILLAVIYPSLDWIRIAGQIFLWSSIALTLYSGYVYVIEASKVLSKA